MPTPSLEQATTLFEWQAPAHVHQPKTIWWYVTFAALGTAIVALFIVMGNFIAAIAIGCVGALLYYVLQQKPHLVRYRLMADGVAIRNVLYPYNELAAFNIVYEPGHVKSVLIRGKRRLAPLLHLEIDEADPVAIRDILIEFLPEDQELEEPFVDILTRRLGF